MWLMLPDRNQNWSSLQIKNQWIDSIHLMANPYPTRIGPELDSPPNAWTATVVEENTTVSLNIKSHSAKASRLVAGLEIDLIYAF